mmetsp:Transcript_74498/g.199138  ORF Transcript_74498/g.199138 Transcript_74498/m.199138 type:complete len:207 (+) Transcript_74498:613-1233(+)
MRSSGRRSLRLLDRPSGGHVAGSSTKPNSMEGQVLRPFIMANSASYPGRIVCSSRMALAMSSRGRPIRWVRPIRKSSAEPAAVLTDTNLLAPGTKVSSSARLSCALSVWRSSSCDQRRRQSLGEACFEIPASQTLVLWMPWRIHPWLRQYLRGLRLKACEADPLGLVSELRNPNIPPTAGGMEKWTTPTVLLATGQDAMNWKILRN